MTPQRPLRHRQRSLAADYERLPWKVIRTPEQRYLTSAALQFFTQSAEFDLVQVASDELVAAQDLRERLLADMPAELPRILSGAEQVLATQTLMTLAVQKPAPVTEFPGNDAVSLAVLARGYQGQIPAIQYYLR